MNNFICEKFKNANNGKVHIKTFFSEISHNIKFPTWQKESNYDQPWSELWHQFLVRTVRTSQSEEHFIKKKHSVFHFSTWKMNNFSDHANAHDVTTSHKVKFNCWIFVLSVDYKCNMCVKLMCNYRLRVFTTHLYTQEFSLTPFYPSLNPTTIPTDHH